MSRLSVLTGLSAILLGMIYVTAFIYFGAFFAYPADAPPPEKLQYLADHQAALSLVYFAIYVVFGFVLALLVVWMHQRFKDTQPLMSQLASLFGAIWVALVIASGMIFIGGLSQAVSFLGEDPDKGFTLWRTVSVVANSIGGGNEIVGGAWVLGVSLLALNKQLFSKALNLLGCFVGLAGIATAYPLDVLTEIFGVSQILWFFWLGVAILRTE